MKTIRDFLRKYALLLLTALVVVSVPVGGALGKYAASETVTNGMSLNVSMKPATIYTYNVKNGLDFRSTLLKYINSDTNSSYTKIRFCRMPPSGAEIVPSVTLGAEASDNIQLWKDENTLYITPNDATAVMVFNENCYLMLSYFSNVTNIVFDDYAIDTGKVKNMSSMFLNDKLLSSITFPSSFDTSLVTNMSKMFMNCSALSSISFGENFKTSNVTTMESMFTSCGALTTVNLSGFDFSNVTNLKNFLRECSLLNSITFPTRVKLAAGTSMQSMFESCKGLTTLDLTMFDTTNVTDMSYMFYRCIGLLSVDLSSFNTTNVTTMSNMFCWCKALKTIYASDMFVVSGTDCKNMFGGEGSNTDERCVNLEGGKGTTYDVHHNKDDYAHIDGGKANPGYFTDKNATQSLTYSATGTDEAANGFGLALDLAS